MNHAETLKSPAVMERNLLDFVQANVTLDDMTAGKEWYAIAHGECLRLSAEYGVSLRKAVAVVAVLSPANSWGQNLADAETVLHGFTTGASVDSLTVCTYGPNVSKAYAILSGSDRDAFRGIGKGRKTRSFALNMWRPGQAHAVTIDRHAVAAAIGEPCTLTLTRPRYRAVQDAYKALADRYGMLPCEMQATVWVAWRRVHVAEHVLNRDPQVGV